MPAGSVRFGYRSLNRLRGQRNCEAETKFAAENIKMQSEVDWLVIPSLLEFKVDGSSHNVCREMIIY